MTSGSIIGFTSSLPDIEAISSGINNFDTLLSHNHIVVKPFLILLLKFNYLAQVGAGRGLETLIPWT